MISRLPPSWGWLLSSLLLISGALLPLPVRATDPPGARPHATRVAQSAGLKAGPEAGPEAGGRSGGKAKPQGGAKRRIKPDTGQPAAVAPTGACADEIYITHTQPRGGLANTVVKIFIKDGFCLYYLNQLPDSLYFGRVPADTFSFNPYDQYITVRVPVGAVTDYIYVGRLDPAYYAMKSPRKFIVSADTIAPALVEVGPVGSGLAPLANDTVRVTFSKTMDSLTVGALSVTSSHSGRRAGRTWLSNGGTEVLYVPTTPFRPGEKLNVVVTGEQAVAVNGDVAVGNYADFFTVRGQPAAGSFVPGPVLAPGAQVGPLATADLNGDGALDVVAAAPGGQQIRYWLNAGGGAFAAPVVLAVPGLVAGFRLVDIGADGQLDLLTFQRNGPGYLFLNRGGTFAPARLTNLENGIDVTVGKTGSIYDDQFVALTTHHPRVFMTQMDTLGAALQIGFHQQLWQSASCVLANFDRRTNSEVLLVPEVANSTVAIQQYEGPQSSLSVGLGAASAAAADLDHDGDADFVVANATDNTVSVRPNAGTGTFGPGTEVPVGAAPTRVLLADIDGDGDPDLLTLNSADYTVSIARNDGRGQFGAATAFSIGARQQPRELLVEDMDGDGTLDLLLSCPGDSTVRLYLNQAPAQAVIVASGATTLCAGATVVLTATGLAPGTTWQWQQNGQPLAGATASTYTASQTGTYTVVATTSGGTVSTSAPTAVVVAPPPSAAFSYAAADFCLRGANPVPTRSGAAGGLFSADSPRLHLDPVTGVIALRQSQPGTYTVRYQLLTPCPVSQTVTVTLTAPPSAAFYYPNTSRCAGAPDTLRTTLQPYPGATRGRFTATPAGLALDSVTGNVFALNSLPGNYLVTNTVTTADACGQTSSIAALSVGMPLNLAITASGPTTFCMGQSVTLRASGGTFYAWSNGIFGASIVVTTPGTYTVRSTDQGCTTISPPVTVVVTQPTPLSLTAAGPTTFCPGGNVLLQASGLAAGATYRFLRDNIPVQDSADSTFLANQPGSYQVVSFNAAGCLSTSTTPVAVTVSPTITATFYYLSLSYCQQSGGLISPYVTGGQGGTYSATPAGLSLDSVTGVINAGLSALGSYTITRRLNGLCPTSFSVGLAMVVPPQASFTYPAASLCLGTSNVSLSPTFAPLAYAGAFTASPPGLAINPYTGTVIVSGSQPGTYRIRNTVANLGTCPSDTATFVLTLHPAVTATVTAAGSQGLCAGDSLVLTAGSNVPGATFQWSNGAVGPVITVGASGNYGATATTPGGCQAVAPPLTVVVLPLPPQPTITVSTDSTGATVLTSSAPTGNQWLRNGQPIARATTPTYRVAQAAQNGRYAVVVTDGQGCVSPVSSEVQTSVTATARPLVAGAFSLFPNPAQGTVRLQRAGSAAPAATTVTLLDAVGRAVRIYPFPAGSAEVQLALGGLPQGVYTVRTGGATARLVVQ